MPPKSPASPPTTTRPPAPECRGRVFESVLETVGATPIVRLGRIAAEARVKADILGKCEFFNPLASVKDRIGLAMIEAAEQRGELKPGGVIVEGTSGNTGVGLAMAAARNGNGSDTAARNQTKRAGMNGISQRIMR